jgi:hypothetical protein
MLRKLLRHENKFHPEHNQPLWLSAAWATPARVMFTTGTISAYGS